MGHNFQSLYKKQPVKIYCELGQHEVYTKNPRQVRKMLCCHKCYVRDHFDLTQETHHKLLFQPCKLCHGEYNKQLDHIIPLSEGGTNTLDNFQVLCFKCHSKKHPWINQSWEINIPMVTLSKRRRTCEESKNYRLIV